MPCVFPHKPCERSRSKSIPSNSDSNVEKDGFLWQIGLHSVFEKTWREKGMNNPLVALDSVQILTLLSRFLLRLLMMVEQHEARLTEI